ncbi:MULTISPECIES: GNAT family N-acetyltransferase [Thermocrispum]|uniref:GNAT family N-acetyltransferase n=1 Tax=Thermocrispum TaxID=37924 RepID=UPI000411069E|nr:MULTISPECIES: GNAT family N-acetyltransferase [Thermocrispum]
MNLTFRHYDHETAPATVDDVIVPLYLATHPQAATDPFYSVERFTERVEGYMRSPGFGMCAAFDEDKPVGLAFGYALPENARWWRSLQPHDPELTIETGTRTFAINEIMTHPDHQRRHVARDTHRELLATRREERATLLVDEANTPAVTAYRRWGYRKVGTIKPFPDSPTFAAMILPLPPGGHESFDG